MLRIPQHLKKECSSEEFSALLAGTKVFEVSLGSLNLQDGDLVTFVEVESGVETGRVITKRVTTVQRTKDLDFLPEEEQKYGYVVAGLLQPETNTLRSILSGYFLMAFAIKKVDTFQWEITQGPTYWPHLVCPDLKNSGILNSLKLHKWPNGVYAIHLKIKPEVVSLNEPITISVVDAFILAMAESQGELVGIEVTASHLMLGKAISVFEETEIQPLSPDEVARRFAIPPADAPRISDEQLVVKLGGISANEVKEVIHGP